MSLIERNSQTIMKFVASSKVLQYLNLSVLQKKVTEIQAAFQVISCGCENQFWTLLAWKSAVNVICPNREESQTDPDLYQISSDLIRSTATFVLSPPSCGAKVGNPGPWIGWPCCWSIQHSHWLEAGCFQPQSHQFASRRWRIGHNWLLLHGALLWLWCLRVLLCFDKLPLWVWHGVFNPAAVDWAMRKINAYTRWVVSWVRSGVHLSPAGAEFFYLTCSRSVRPLLVLWGRRG